MQKPEVHAEPRGARQQPAVHEGYRADGQPGMQALASRVSREQRKQGLCARPVALPRAAALPAPTRSPRRRARFAAAALRRRAAAVARRALTAAELHNQPPHGQHRVPRLRLVPTHAAAPRRLNLGSLTAIVEVCRARGRDEVSPDHASVRAQPRPARARERAEAAQRRRARRAVGRDAPLEQQRREARQVAGRVQPQPRQQARQRGGKREALRGLVGGVLDLREQLLCYRVQRLGARVVRILQGL